MRNSKGFSLIEVMIGLGLVGIMMTVGLSVASYFSEIKQNSKAAVSQLELMKSIDSALKFSCTCNYARAGSELVYSGTGDMVLPDLKFYDGCTSPKDVIVDASGNMPWSNSNLKITSMSVTNIIANGSVVNSFVGDLKVEMKIGNVQQFPYKTASKPFVFTRNPANGNKITDCSYQGSSGGGTSASAVPNTLTVAEKASLAGQFSCSPTSGTYGNDPGSSYCYCTLPPGSTNTLPNGKALIVNLKSEAPMNSFQMAPMPSCPAGYTLVNSCVLSPCSSPCGVVFSGGHTEINCIYTDTW